MDRRKRVALLTSTGALACLVVASLVAWSTTRSRASVARPLEPGRSASALAGPLAVPSAAASSESVPPPPTLAEARADSRKLSSACATLRLANHRVYEQSTQRLGPDSTCSINLVVDSLGCTTAASGVTWGYRLVSATVTSSLRAPSCRSKWHIELVRRSQADSETVARGGELSFDLGEYDDASVQLQALSDYDGDGEPELLRTVYRKAHEGDAESVALVMTYHAGRIQEYAPSRAASIVSVEDVDGDGLLDLLGPGPYRSVSTQSDIGTEVSVAPSLFVHHAERDGSFSMVSPASLAYTARQCPRSSMPPFVAGDIDNPSELARALVCARLWGTQAAEIEARFKTICPLSFEQGERAHHGRQLDDAGEDAAIARRSCREWVLELARVTPPFTLR
jgi:hypothetical protein